MSELNLVDVTNESAGDVSSTELPARGLANQHYTDRDTWQTERDQVIARTCLSSSPLTFVILVPIDCCSVILLKALG